MAFGDHVTRVVVTKNVSWKRGSKVHGFTPGTAFNPLNDALQPRLDGQVGGTRAESTLPPAPPRNQRLMSLLGVVWNLPRR